MPREPVIIAVSGISTMISEAAQVFPGYFFAFIYGCQSLLFTDNIPPDVLLPEFMFVYSGGKCYN